MRLKTKAQPLWPHTGAICLQERQWLSGRHADAVNLKRLAVATLKWCCHLGLRHPRVLTCFLRKHRKCMFHILEQPGVLKSPFPLSHLFQSRFHLPPLLFRTLGSDSRLCTMGAQHLLVTFTKNGNHWRNSHHSFWAGICEGQLLKCCAEPQREQEKTKTVFKAKLTK